MTTIPELPPEAARVRRARVATLKELRPLLAAYYVNVPSDDTLTKTFKRYGVRQISNRPPGGKGGGARYWVIADVEKVLGRVTGGFLK